MGSLWNQKSASCSAVYGLETRSLDSFFLLTLAVFVCVSMRAMGWLREQDEHNPFTQASAKLMSFVWAQGGRVP